MTKKLIGYCAVDSGQIMIVDPCYVMKETTEEQAEKMYKSACDLSLSKDGHGEVLCVGIAGFGVVSKTYDGDGNYPVYANIDKTGRPRSITIKLA